MLASCLVTVQDRGHSLCSPQTSALSTFHDPISPMSSKVQQLPQDNTGTSVLSQLAPAISPASSVLASIIPLPEHSLIAYSVFACPPATHDILEQLEKTRKVVLLQNEGKTLLDSLLPAVHVTKDSFALFVFAIGSTARTCDAHDALLKLQLPTVTSECTYPTVIMSLSLWGTCSSLP